MSAHDPIDPNRDERLAKNEVERPTEHETDPTSAIGGLGGAAIGAAAGSLGGPIGIAIGALAGGTGGWWAGRKISHAAQDYETSEPEFRERHAAHSDAQDYETARPAYQLGYLAGRNPEYRSRKFEDIEEHVQLGWSPIAASHGPWRSVREYARDAYDVGQESSSRLDREVPIERAVEEETSESNLDEQLATADDDPIAHPAEPAEAVYPTELDALANGIPAEPGSEAAHEFGISDAEVKADQAANEGVDRELSARTSDDRTRDDELRDRPL